MGIPGLYSLAKQEASPQRAIFLTNPPIDPPSNSTKAEASESTLIIDGVGWAYYLYRTNGNDASNFIDGVKNILNAVINNLKLQIIMVVDSENPTSMKEKETLTRRQGGLNQANVLMRSLASKKDKKDKNSNTEVLSIQEFPPVLLLSWLECICRSYMKEVTFQDEFPTDSSLLLNAAGEADDLIVNIVRSKLSSKKKIWIMSNDSDFFVFDFMNPCYCGVVPFEWFYLSSHSKDEKTLSLTFITQESVARSLRLGNKDELISLAALAGHDFSPSLTDLHSFIFSEAKRKGYSGRLSSKTGVLFACAGFIRNTPNLLEHNKAGKYVNDAFERFSRSKTIHGSARNEIWWPREAICIVDTANIFSNNNPCLFLDLLAPLRMKLVQQQLGNDSSRTVYEVFPSKASGGANLSKHKMEITDGAIKLAFPKTSDSISSCALFLMRLTSGIIEIWEWNAIVAGFFPPPKKLKEASLTKSNPKEVARFLTLVDLFHYTFRLTQRIQYDEEGMKQSMCWKRSTAASHYFKEPHNDKIIEEMQENADVTSHSTGTSDLIFLEEICAPRRTVRLPYNDKFRIVIDYHQTLDRSNTGFTVWPSSLYIAQYLINHKEELENLIKNRPVRMLEISAGISMLPTIAATIANDWKCIVTDVKDILPSMEKTLQTVRVNNDGEPIDKDILDNYIKSIQIKEFDWFSQYDFDDIEKKEDGEIFDIAVLADVLHSTNESVLIGLAKCLAENIFKKSPNCIILIGYQPRHVESEFLFFKTILSNFKIISHLIPLKDAGEKGKYLKIVRLTYIG